MARVNHSNAIIPSAAATANFNSPAGVGKQLNELECKRLGLNLRPLWPELDAFAQDRFWNFAVQYLCRIKEEILFGYAASSVQGLFELE